MQKSLFLLIALCLHIAARGQTEYEFEYWFDNDRSTLQTGHSMTPSWQIEADLSSLGEKLHAIHVQVRDPDGVSSVPVTRYFLKASSLSGMSLRYWFDDDSLSVQEGHNTGNPLLLDVAGLADGYHTLQIQTADGFGDVSAPVTKGFIKIPQTIGAGDFTCICMIDDQVFKQEKVSTSQGIVAWDFDVSSLSPGFHRIFIQIVTPSGAASNAWQSFFLREPTLEEYGEMKCVYAIDGAEFYTETGTMTDGSFHFDLDVSSLENGLHRITYMLNNGKGVTTPIQTQFFTKIPLGGNGISEYWYWLNELGDEQAHKVTLPERTNPFSLISLLPVESQPIRSKLFQFRIEDGNPMMYAKNDFHIRFFDVAGRFTDVSKQYVDESVKQEVKPVGELQDSQTFDKVAENNVRWYTMPSAPGDTAAFKLSQPATVQVFAPSGEEVFKTSESASVKWSGIHTWENGTYYLAVHDVTGSQSTMKLEYMHMDKYDVVDWDVHRVGNGGCSTITFKGNGFRDLYAVDLVIAPGDTVRSVAVSHDSDAETAVTFDFTAATLGDYNAVFHFTEEDKPVANVVTVEEAVDIELATDVSFPSSFSRSATYTVKITNKGNMTAYAVPVYTWIKSLTQDGIYHIDYDGLDLANIFDGIETDSLTESEIAELYSYAETCGDDHHFLKFWAEDENHIGDSIFVRSNYFFTNIAPHETKTLRLTIYTREVDTYAYFTVPEDWPNYSINRNEPAAIRIKTHFKSQKQQSAYCCIADKIDCVLSTASFWLDMGSAVSFVFGPEVAAFINAADCATSVAGAVNKTSRIIACGDEGSEDDLRSMIGNAAKSAISAAISCVAAKFSKLGNLKYLKEHSRYSNLGTGLSALVAYLDKMHPDDGDFSCFKDWTKRKPGCPPPPPNGGDSHGGKSHDPNDIYGYLSEAGSKFIADSVARVNYTIEFENDTTFATAAAHTIVIKDTLDNKVFDLTKFMPTGIRIGEREAFLDEADVVTKNNVTSFVKTIDMRPEINAIAQVDGTFNQKNGIAQWMLQSLDPMTMEPTDDLMQGILPVNYNGASGIGEVMFEVGVKQGKADGTQIKNRAGIVFDYEEAILTPTWTNIVDAIAPSSFIDEVVHENDSTISFHFFGEDNASGIWKYRFYVQAGQNAPWWEIATDIAPDRAFCYRFYDDIDYGFCVLAVDSAGNVEKKVLQRECNFKAHEGDYEVNVDELPASSTGSTGDSRIYDLSGRRHNEPQEGINIIDNKKVLFRRKK